MRRLVRIVLRIAAGIKIHHSPEGFFERVFAADFRTAEPVAERLVALVGHRLAEGLAHALRHGEIKGVDGLAAEHIVLIGLNRNAGEARISADGIRLAQESVSGRKAAAEQLQQIDLAAVERDQGKIFIVDVNPVLFVRLAELVRQNIVVHEVLGALRAELQHDAHGRIRIDVGIVALEVDIHRIRKEDIPIGRHQMLLRRTAFRMFLAVGDVFFGHIVEIVLHEFTFDDVLDLLDADIFPVLNIPFDLTRHFVNIPVRHAASAVHIGAGNRMKNLFTVIGHRMARTFRNGFQIHRLNDPRIRGIISRLPLYIVVFVCRDGIYCIREALFWQWEKIPAPTFFPGNRAAPPVFPRPAPLIVCRAARPAVH